MGRVEIGLRIVSLSYRIPNLLRFFVVVNVFFLIVLVVVVIVVIVVIISVRITAIDFSDSNSAGRW